MTRAEVRDGKAAQVRVSKLGALHVQLDQVGQEVNPFILFALGPVYLSKRPSNSLGGFLVYRLFTPRQHWSCQHMVNIQTVKKGLKFLGVLNVTPHMLEKTRLNDLDKYAPLVTVGNRPNTLFRFQPR